MALQVRGSSDVGRVRTTNEDCYAWWTPEEEASRLKRGLLLVVADGMGGAQAGEEASRIAVDAVVRAYGEAPGLDPLQDLAQAIQQANTEVFEKSRTSPEFHGMGTTSTAVVVRGHDLLIGHVGDSRAYLVRKDGIRCLTSDHSLVGEMVRHGQITAEQARVHPRRNIVTRAIGVGPTVEADLILRKGLMNADSAVVLCSDGLHGILEDREIWRLCCLAGWESAGSALIQAANEAGGPDNITVLVAWIS